MADVDTDLPKSQLKRIVKGKLGTTADGKEISLASDALLAFGESAKVFISYLSACANDICKESKRQTISADDVFKALEELEFDAFIPALKDFLEVYKKAAKGKSAAQKKRKATDEGTGGGADDKGAADKSGNKDAGKSKGDACAEDGNEEGDGEGQDEGQDEGTEGEGGDGGAADEGDAMEEDS